MRRLGNQATYGFNAALNTNPGGGGASRNAEAPMYRGWVEGYGLTSRTGPQGDFVGDRRQTYGGVAGLAATLAPGFSLGVSVDQGRTRIDVPLALQSATLDLTQIGINGSYTTGPWTLAFAAVHGFAGIHSKRATTLGIAAARYDAQISGVLSELSYYWAIGQGRIVPKLGVEYVSARTDPLQEIGGLNPVSATQARAERTKILIGAEVGHYWIVDQRVLDLAAYGKFIDNVTQAISSVQVSLGSNSIAVQGVRESRYGFDGGATASLSLTNTARVYVNYDAKLRDGFHSHQGTAGLELKW